MQKNKARDLTIGIVLLLIGLYTLATSGMAGGTGTEVAGYNFAMLGIPILGGWFIYKSTKKS